MLSTSETSRTPSFSRNSTNSSSRKLEFVSLAIPIAGVVVINQFVITLGLSSLSESVDLTGLQWYWILGNTDVTLASTLEVGQLLALYTSNLVVLSSQFLLILSAVDVIHAVALPSLGVKADAIPGRLVNVRVNSEVPGLYAGQCSELCGAMHAFMPLNVALVCLRSLSAMRSSPILKSTTFSSYRIS